MKRPPGALDCRSQRSLETELVSKGNTMKLLAPTILVIAALALLTIPPSSAEDASPTKDLMIAQSERNARLFELAFGKRPREELYDCRKDPHQLHNLAADLAYRATLEDLSTRLTEHLKATDDPRETTDEAPWDAWEYHGRKNWPILPDPTSNTKPDAGEDIPSKKLK